MIPLLAFAVATVSPICPDRPAKGTSPCTVEAGHWQLEVDVADRSRSRQGLVTEIDWMALAPTIKLGIGPATDVELSLVPFSQSRIRSPAGRSSTSGFGDTMVKLKQRLTAPDAPVTAALVPFIKIPTAGHNLGNGKVEEGLVAPLAFALPRGWSLGVTPELDRLADGDGRGFHAGGSASAGLNIPLTPKLTATLEGWAARDWDPAGTVRQASADLALAYQPVPSIQFDGGANFGLNRATPGLQLYAGFSTRL